MVHVPASLPTNQLLLSKRNLNNKNISGSLVYLDAGREQQELQAEGSGEEDGAPCEGHASGGLLPGGSRGSVIVGATLRSGFIPLRVGHARAETELQLFFPKEISTKS